MENNKENNIENSENHKAETIYLQQSTSSDSAETTSTNNYGAFKTVAEGCMDIALLTANANQLRYLLAYNFRSLKFYFSLALLIISLGLQIIIGAGLIFKRFFKKRWSPRRINDFLVFGTYMVTVVNVLLTAVIPTDGNPLPQGS